ncbi:hypothetical protein ACVW1C_005984 [Bradyrhizobium sp. USDA 4011]
MPTDIYPLQGWLTKWTAIQSTMTSIYDTQARYRIDAKGAIARPWNGDLNQLPGQRTDLFTAGIDRNIHELRAAVARPWSIRPVEE